jgi:protein required for attachment to host cells
MKRACIAIVDAARARLYAYQQDADPGKELREVRDLVNAGRRMNARELMDETRPSAEIKDDHRDDHIAMMDGKFAKEIVEELDKLVHTEALGHVILIASPKMLGELRKHNGGLKRNGLVVDEIPRELANLTGTQLHDHLASLDLIPGRQRLKMAR